jgi:tetratricopeptide (TPR) repeat protein
MEDLEDAIQNARRAVELTPDDHPSLSDMLRRLSSCLSDRYNRLGKMEDLEDAIQNARRAVELTPDDHPSLSDMLGNLSICLSDRYNRLGKMEDLEDVIQNAQRAVKLTPDDHPSLSDMLGGLSGCLSARYNRLGNMEDLEDAIQNARRAVELTPDGHPSLAGKLNNMGLILTRYHRTGNMEDLEEAIQYTQRAVDITPSDDPDLTRRLKNIAECLASRYKRTGNLEDLEAAIQNARRAIDTIPQDHPRLANRLAALASYLSDRHNKTGMLADLEEAIKNAQRAVDITPSDHPNLGGALAALAECLSGKDRLTRKIEDMDRTVQTAQRAVETTPEDHPDLAGRLNSLARYLSCRYERTLNKTDRDQAVNYYQMSFDCKNGIPLERITAVRGAINLLVTQEDRLPEASYLAGEAVELLPMVCSRYLSREDQQHAVTQTSGLAADACSLLLRTNNDPSRALEYLEQGRGVIIGYLIDARGDISDLMKRFPKEGKEFDRLRYKASMLIDPEEPHDVQRRLLEERKAAAADLEHCVRDIRERLPGYDRFLLPPSSDDLKSCANEGPIVVVNVTSISSDALIVLPKEPIKPVNLPELRGLKGEQYRLWGLTRSTRNIEPMREGQQSRRFRRFLSRLWSSCVRLVLKELGFLSPPRNADLPRIWWIGTGLACSLPFHAAGHHATASTENTFSCAISSYTPSIKSLRYAKEKATVTFSDPSVLLVTMLTTPGANDLPGVEKETEEICTAIQNQHVLRTLAQPSADTVLKELKNCKIVHFACHGSSDLSDPSSSFLALQGQSSTVPDRLTVQKISESQLGQAWLAYLSACSTAENRAADLADEALHLASGFQVAGFGHTIASMWPSNDDICAQVARVFYREFITNHGFRRGSRAVAAALHSAVSEVRTQHSNHPSLWAQYIHTGA